MQPSAPTTDAIRAAIDTGAAHDKVAVADPATVPLGTDAEAAGFAPTPPERRLEAARLGRPHRAAWEGVTPTFLGYGGLVVTVAAMMLGAIALGILT